MSSVVRGHRPVLLDRHIGRHSQAIRLAAVIGLGVLVANGDQVELAGAQTLDGDVGVGVGDAARIDRVPVVRGIGRALALDGFRQGRQGPVGALEERRKPAS